VSRRAVAFVASGLLLVGCGSSATNDSSKPTAPATTSSPVSTSTTVGVTTATTLTTTTAVRKPFAPDAFDATDALLEERVRAAGQSRGIIKIVAEDGAVIHEHTVGGMSGTTPIDVASSTKWLTAITFMTFVDDGAVKLDDDISKWLPEFGGSNPPITARQLLTHTSGVHDNPCQNGGAVLATCVRTLASSSREFTAGSAFSYGNAPFLVVGRLIEELGGTDFASVVRIRLTGPLGMDATTWPGAPTAANPAFGVRITVDDYGKLLDMVLHGGVSNGVRVLSSDAVTQMISDQVSRYDTSHDYSVGITGIPRYGLGCWPDVVDESGKTAVVSGNGGKGLYPWVDFTTHTWGVVGVQDERGAQLAVPASQKVEVEARTAVADP
jgi:CubicO group peptidase (beta-lactamase class C family)